MYPVAHRRALELSAFATVVAVLIASSLLGVVGAILAVPTSAILQVLFEELGPEATRD